MNLLAAIGQALDFLWKAAQEYANTPEGAKELNDVISALEGGSNVTSDNQPQSETTSNRRYG